MKTNPKSIIRADKLNNVEYQIRGPLLDEANRMRSLGEDIIALNIGNPAPFAFEAPSHLINNLADRLRNAQGYSDSSGLPKARQAIVEYYRKKGVEISEHYVYTGNGASELIVMALQALLNVGDEVLLPSPDYPLWTAATAFSGGKPVHYLLDENANWYPDIADMRRKITNRTRAILVINPNNPTGAVYPKEVLEQIVQVAREHQLILIVDEIYDRLLMDDSEHISVASLSPDLLTITFNGLSKSHMICGFRCGWVCFSGAVESAKDYIDGFRTLASMRLCSNVPAQTIIADALADPFATRALYLPGGRIYEQREVIWKKLNELDCVSVVKPKAAFYVFPKINMKALGYESDEQFAMDLLREKKVQLVPGSGFHRAGNDHVRIVYLAQTSILQTAVSRLADFIAEHKK
ncbi:MAG: pyridoxal phosphate-dependent aminotransferase [Ruminococcaceae bacterium]|nr:pyridoxal phosphate-dependent aminotransferase [Oscillospiraceae bacterium]